MFLLQVRSFKNRVRRRIITPVLVLVVALSGPVACEYITVDTGCGGDPFCNPLVLALAYTQPFVGVGSNIANCTTYRAILPGDFYQTGAHSAQDCKFLGGVATGNGRYVGVGKNDFGEGPTTQCIAVYSWNGVDWNPGNCNSSAGAGLETLAYVGGYFLASSTGNLAAQLRASSDGITWSVPPTGPPQGIDDFLYLNGVVYAAARNGVYLSTDPLSVPFSSTGSGTESYKSLAAGPDGRIVAVGRNGSVPVVKVFVNGSWVTGNGFYANATGGELPAEVIFDGARFIAAGGGTDASTGGDCFVDFSYDGITWRGGYTMHPGCAQTTLNWQAHGLVIVGSQITATGLVFTGSTATASVLQSTSVESGVWSHAFLPGNNAILDITPAL